MKEVIKVDRRSAHRRTAVMRARSVVDYLKSLGIEAKIIGSLARGAFAPSSDVDFLVTACPRSLKYTIEGSVEDRMRDIPFDVVYLDETPAWKARRLSRDAIDASALS